MHEILLEVRCEKSEPNISEQIIKARFVPISGK